MASLVLFGRTVETMSTESNFEQPKRWRTRLKLSVKCCIWSCIMAQREGGVQLSNLIIFDENPVFCERFHRLVLEKEALRTGCRGVA